MPNDRDGSQQVQSRPIGSLAKQIVNSHSGSASTSRPSSLSSSTTGLAREFAKQIGTRLSATDAGRLPTVVLALREADLADLDRAIVASLPPSIASTLMPRYRDRIDPKYGFDTEFLGFAVGELVPQADKETAKQSLVMFMRPADEQTIKREIARLRVSTKSRAETDDDMAMGFQVLAEECAKYPPDVVILALRSWAGMETFYPSLAEMRDRLQRGVRKRKAVWEALNNQPVECA